MDGGGLMIDIENQAAAAGRSGKVGLLQSGGGGLSGRNTAKTPGTAHHPYAQKRPLNVVNV